MRSDVCFSGVYCGQEITLAGIVNKNTLFPTPRLSDRYSDKQDGPFLGYSADENGSVCHLDSDRSCHTVNGEEGGCRGRM